MTSKTLSFLILIKMTYGTFAQVAKWDIPGSNFCLNHSSVTLYSFRSKGDQPTWRPQGGSCHNRPHPQMASVHFLCWAESSCSPPGRGCANVRSCLQTAIGMGSRVREWKRLLLLGRTIDIWTALVPSFLPTFTPLPKWLYWVSKHSKASLSVQSIPGSPLFCPQSFLPSSFHLDILHLSLSCHVSKSSTNWSHFVSLWSRLCDAQKWGLILLISPPLYMSAHCRDSAN